MVGYWTLKSLLEQRNFEKFVETLKNDLQFGQLGVNYPYECPVLVALLHTACQSKGCHKFVEILLQNGADINHPSEEKFSKAAIHFAVENADLETLTILLNDLNCDVNALSMEKYSALHYAVKHDDVDCIKLLLQHSGIIDINVVGDADQTPLHLALNNNCRKAIYELLEHPEIDLDVLRDDFGHTCRQLINFNYPEFALKISRIGSMRGENKNLFSLLYENNISKFCEQVMISKPNSTDHDGKYTYLQYACYYGLVEVVDILLTVGIDPNQYCPNNTTTPVMITIERGYHAILKVLLQDTRLSFESVDHNVVSSILIDGMFGVNNSPLSDNTECDYFKCLQYLQQTSRFHFQFDINHPNAEGYTLLHCAITLNNVEIMRGLLNVGAQFNLDINIPSNNGDTPLHSSIAMDNEEMVKVLLDAGSDYNLDINKPNNDGNTPLHYAIQCEKEEIVKALLTFATNYHLDISHPNKEGYTPLQSAIIQQYKEITKAILNAWIILNLDLNHRANDGNTLLHYAIMFKDEAIIEVLLADSTTNNLEINQKNNDGNTPLHYAIQHENEEIVIALLAVKDKFHLDISCLNNGGYTPLHSAVIYGNEGIIKALLHAGAHVGQLTRCGITPLHFMQGSVLEEYLDKCISTNKEAPTLPQYEIIFDYSVITPKQESAANKDITYKTEMESMLIMSNTPELREILTHPVLLSFLNLRWYTIAKYFYISLIFHFIFYTLLTSYICYINYSSSNHNNTQLSKNYSNSLDNHNNSLSLNLGNASTYLNSTSNNSSEYLNTTPFPNDTYSTLEVDIYLWYVLMVSCIIFALKELYQLYTSHKQYLTSAENWLEICLISLTFILLFSKEDFKHQHKLSSIIIVVLGINLMFLIGRHPLCSIYIEMFKAVSINFLKLFVCYLILILSFALSFYILFKNGTREKNLFGNPALAVFKSIIMLTGEFDTDSIPLNTYDLTGYFLFILFVFLIAIVLFNLSNGLAVSDTQAIKSDAKLVVIVSKVKLISYMEGIVIRDYLKCINFVRIIVRCCISFCRQKGCRYHKYQQTDESNNLFPYTFPHNKMHVLPNDRNITRLQKLDSTKEICLIDSYIVEHAKKILEKNKQQEKDAKERDSQKQEYILRIKSSIEELFQVHKKELEIIVDSKLESVINRKLLRNH